MTAPTNPGSNVYSLGFGNTPIASLGCVPVIQTRSPSPSDTKGSYGVFALGQVWVNSVAGASYQLLSLSTIGGTLRANWALVSSASGELANITTQDSTVVVPSAGTIFLNGAAGEFTTTGSGSTVTINYTDPSTLPGAIVVGGGVPAASTLATFNSLGNAQTLITRGNKGTLSLGGSQFGIVDNTLFLPVVSNNISASITASPSFTAALGQTMTAGIGLFVGTDAASNVGTITTVYGLYIPVVPAVSGTVSNYFGAFIADPGTGTAHMALYSDNATLGNSSIIPPAGGLYVSGNAIFNAALDVTGNANIGTSLSLADANTKLFINAGTPATSIIGTATLVAGTVTVSTTAVTASSLIFVSYFTPGGTQASLSIGTITPGVSFVINSSNVADTSTVNYLIVN
jgi:hypothetical protein